MSKSRAKKKQRRRTQAASAPAADVPVPARDAVQARRARVTQHARVARHERVARRESQRRPEPVGHLPTRFEVRDGVARPEPPWAPFPLTEIAIFVGLVLFLLGYFASADRSPALLGAGALVLIVSVAEMCLREHFGGFRSHSILLALLPVTVVHTLVVYAITTSWTGPIALLVDLAIAGALAWFLHQRFQRAHADAEARAGRAAA